MRRLAADASLLLNDLVEEIIISENIQKPTVDFSTLSESPDSATPEAESSKRDAGIDLQALQVGVQQIGGLVKPEHIVNAMKLGKDLLPSLFKGIGPVTMGKVGQQIAGKIVPVIGIAIQAGQVLYSLFGSDPEEERIRNEVRLREEQEERKNQVIKDLSETIAWEFRTAVIKAVDEQITHNFAEIKSKLKDIRNGFSQVQRELSEDRASLVESVATLQAYV